MINAGQITFSSTGIVNVFAPGTTFVEFNMGVENGANSQGVYWSWGMGDVTFQRAVSICGRDNVLPEDRTKTQTDRILVARRKVSGAMTEILNVELVGIDPNYVSFNVHIANPAFGPIMKVY